MYLSRVIRLLPDRAQQLAIDWGADMEPKIFNHLGEPNDEVLDLARTMPLVHGDQAAAHLPSAELPEARVPAK